METNPQTDESHGLVGATLGRPLWSPAPMVLVPLAAGRDKPVPYDVAGRDKPVPYDPGRYGAKSSLIISSAKIGAAMAIQSGSVSSPDS